MRPHPLAAAICTAVLLSGFATPAASASAATLTAPAPPSTTVDYAKWKAGRSKPVADPIYPGRGNPGLDVLHYDLALAWSPEAKELTGTATLRIRPTRDAAALTLDFNPFTLDTVTLDNAPVHAAVTKEKLTVDAPVRKNHPLTLVVGYHGAPKTVPMPSRRGDFGEGLGLRATADGSAWTMQEPYGAFTWYPANDQPSDEALYDIAVTVPQGWSAVASGSPAGAADGTYRYRSAVPVASYLTTLAIGRYKTEKVKGPHGLPLTIWYRPATDKKFLPLLRKQPKYIKWLEKRFGRFPFPTAGAVMVESESAMETQQMVTMGSQWPNWPASKEWFGEVLLHEQAHQWFGDSITPTTWKDLWLNEGFAMYAQLLYDIGRDHQSLKDLERYLRQADARARKRSGPPGKPDPRYFGESNVYDCPALMLLQLHKKLGSKKFFKLARAWVQTQRNTQQNRASFIKFVNKKTGHNYTKMINKWLDSKKTPK